MATRSRRRHNDYHDGADIGSLHKKTLWTNYYNVLRVRGADSEDDFKIHDLWELTNISIWKHILLLYFYIILVKINNSFFLSL